MTNIRTFMVMTDAGKPIANHLTLTEGLDLLKILLMHSDGVMAWTIVADYIEEDLGYSKQGEA